MRTVFTRRPRQRLVVLLAATPFFIVLPIHAQDAGKSPLRLTIAQQANAPQTPARPGPALELSIDQAVDMALETSLGLKAERLNLDIADQGIAGAKASFIPTLSIGFSGTTAQSQPTDFTQGSDNISRHTMGGNGALDQALPWNGTRYHLGWNGNRASQIGGISTFNPQLGSTLSFNVTQPLWRNLAIDSNRANVLSTELTRKISDVNLEQRVVSTEANVRLAYLNLVASIKGQEVAQQNMDIAQDSLRAARARVAVGVAAQIDVIQAQAQAASFEEQLIVANSGISTAEDRLRQMILDPGRADYWQVKLQPTSTILLTEQPIDLDAVIKNALANRLDAQAATRQIEITNLNLRVNQNLEHPSLDVTAAYSATGYGGTQFSYGGSAFAPTILSQLDRSFSSALSDAFLGTYPSWTVGVQLGYPIGRSSAQAAVAQNQLAKKQQETSLQQLQIEIVREVREAARQVQTSYQRVQATQAALTASQEQLDAEQRRFEVGLSSTFELQQRERDLASARQSDLQAKISYNAALITLNAVQKIPQ